MFMFQRNGSQVTEKTFLGHKADQKTSSFQNAEYTIQREEKVFTKFPKVNTPKERETSALTFNRENLILFSFYLSLAIRF